MRSRRDGPSFLAVAVAVALMILALFGAPVAQAGENDTGPELYQLEQAGAIVATLEAVIGLDAAAELRVFCYYESEPSEINLAEHYTEPARNERGRTPSGVARRADCSREFLHDDTLRSPGSTSHPLRC